MPRTNPTLKSPILVCLAIGLAVLLVACGGGEEPAATLPVATPKPAEPTAAPTQPTESAAEHLAAAAAHFEASEYAQAVSELEAALELEPDNADAMANLALAYFKNGDYEKAVAAWTEVIGLDPQAAGPYYERGLSSFNLKQYEQAIADLAQAIELDPASADAFRVRGKAHAFLENHEQAIADFSQAIALDPAADEAYFNRAVSRTKIGTAADLPSIVADYGMVLQISENPDLTAQARQTLETLLQNSDDPAVRQMATDALAGKTVAPEDSGTGGQPSLADIDISRAPGHSIGFEDSLAPGATKRFLFLASPGDTVGASISSASNLIIGIQDTGTGQILGAVPANGAPLFVTIASNSLYHIVIEDAGGQGGSYTAAFEASPLVSFALDPAYFIIGRLPAGGLLYYTFTAAPGVTLQGNAIPHPDTPINLVVRILELETQAEVVSFDAGGLGENEQFSFTIPDNGEGRILTYIVSVEGAGREAGAYILAVSSDAADTAGAPEAVVQNIFDAAKSGNFAALQGLCDPQGENDGDTQSICDMAAVDADREEFVSYFANGRLNGPAEISPAGDMAQVPFLFGPDGDQEATISLVNRNGRWYLYSF